MEPVQTAAKRTLKYALMDLKLSGQDHGERIERAPERLSNLGGRHANGEAVDTKNAISVA